MLLLWSYILAVYSGILEVGEALTGLRYLPGEDGEGLGLMNYEQYIL